MAILQVRNLTKHFGGLKAVSALSFEVREKKISGIIGPNGAGKTTVFNCLTGMYPVTGGEIFFLGERIENLRPFHVAKKGLVKTFQANRIFPELTVRENIQIGLESCLKVSSWGEILGTPRARQDGHERANRVREILAFVDLEKEGDFLARNLPHGSQRRLAIGISLATGPRLLLLDEPATGMNSEEKTKMLALIEKINASGVSVLLIEHDMKLVMNVCEHLVVLNYGEKIAEGTPREISRNEAVITAYLGRKGSKCFT